MCSTDDYATDSLRKGDLWSVVQPAIQDYEQRHLPTQCSICWKEGMPPTPWKAKTGQLVILRFKPDSGSHLLPMRPPNGEKEPTILECIRGRTLTLWRQKYNLVGAFLGVATGHEKLAETAFVEYPPSHDINNYHYYQGTQRSERVKSEYIASWWVLLALVFRESSASGGPCKVLQRGMQLVQAKANRKKKGHA